MTSGQKTGPQARRWLARGVLAAAVAVLAACATRTQGPTESLAIPQAGGTEVIMSNPQKTVVLDLATLDTLHALGVDAVAGLPQAPLPAFLAGYADELRYPRVGPLFEPDAAAIRALAPDLIIVGGRSAGKREELKSIAPTLDLSVPPGDLVAAVSDNVRLLADIYEREEAARPLLQHLHATAQAVRERMQGQGRGLVVLTTGGKIMALPPGPRFGAIYETLGITPLPLEVEPGARGKPVDAAFLREQDPDWLFVIDRDAAVGRDETPARQLLDQPSLRDSRAWREGHVVYLDPVDWYILGAGGITSLQRGLDQVAAALDP